MEGIESALYFGSTAGSELCLVLLWWCSSSALTPNMWGSSYLGLARSISWLLMTWLSALPDHQQPWYWQCKLGSLPWGRISTTSVMSMWRHDIRYKCVFVPCENLTCKRLTFQVVVIFISLETEAHAVLPERVIMKQFIYVCVQIKVLTVSTGHSWAPC